MPSVVLREDARVVLSILEQIAVGEEDEETMRKALGLGSKVFLDEQAKREAELFG